MNTLKWIPILALSVIAISTQSLIAQDGITTREPKSRQVSQAYGFVLAQGYTLNRIETEYPDLAHAVRAAHFAFMSTGLGEGANALEAVLKNELADEWPTTKAKLEEQIHGLGAQRVLTRQLAEQSIDEVKQRAKGKLPESIRNTLLATNPTYVKSPGAELAAGWRQDFSTLKHPKSEDAAITIALPMSWSKRESTHDGVVQVFRNGAGNGPILCTIYCKKVLDDSDGDFTPEEMKELFSKSFIKEAIPKGAAFIEGRSMIIAGEIGAMQIYDMKEETLDVVMKARITNFVIAHKEHNIQVKFEIMEQFLEGLDMDQAQKAYFPTYRAIMSTLARN
jgi:hypothetical protein